MTKVLRVKIEAFDGEQFEVIGDNAVTIVDDHGEPTENVRDAVRKVEAQEYIQVKRNGYGKPFIWTGPYKQLVCN